MTKARCLKLRCFLEGIEVPVISANVQAAPNSPMMASIQLPPLSEGTKLLPRTLVHLFFLDFWADAPTRVLDNSAVPTTQSATLSQPDKINARYKLLFGGEVVGFDWTKTVNNRALVLKCADWSTYWDSAQQFNNTDLFGPGYKALFSGGGTTMLTDFMQSASEVVISLIKSPSIQYPKLKGLLGGLVHLLEAIGGAYYTPNGKTFCGQNIFFSLAELRLHITQMITAYEKDSSSSRLLGGGYDGMFGRTLSGLGDQVSYRKALNALAAAIFHETYAQPCPLFTPGTNNTVNGRGSTTQTLASEPSLQNIVTAAETVAQHINSFVDEIQTSPVFGADAIKKINGLIAEVAMVKSQALSQGYKLANLNFDNATKELKLAAQRIKQSPLLRNMDILTTSNKAVTQVIEDLSGAWYYLRSLVYLPASVDAGLARPARLNQQIIRPDVWFTAPPRCNVVFPENYFHLQYQRSFLEEPTRLLLKTNNEFYGEDELFDQMYFAPKVMGIKKQKKDLWSILQNDIMEHELYTGILPVFEKMGEFNIFGVRANTQTVKKTAATVVTTGGTPAVPAHSVDTGTATVLVPEVLAVPGTTTTIIVNTGSATRTSSIPLAQRSCNFLFARYRYAARQMSILGTFMPYTALGFPGFVIDKYVDAANLASLQKQLNNAGLNFAPNGKLLGTHFLGCFSQICHSLDQRDGGKTEIQMQYPREYSESFSFYTPDDETVDEVNLAAAAAKNGAKPVTVKVPVSGSSISRATAVAAISPPVLGSIGPQGGKILSVEDVTSSYTANSVTVKGMTARAKPVPGVSGKKLPLYLGSRNYNATAKPTYVSVGVRDVASVWGADVVTLVGDPGKWVTFRAYLVIEQVPNYTEADIFVPFEEQIRPGWYGDCWSNQKIGDVYQQFFQTGAITDVQMISGPTGTMQNATSATNALSGAQAAQAVSPSNPNGPLVPAIASLEDGSSIAQACEYIVQVYSYIKSSGLDIDDFIRSYSWRPIATMVDMFGTDNLKYDPSGQTVVTGVEGFHSRAFGPYQDLYGMTPTQTKTIFGVNAGSGFAKRADTRMAKYLAVRSYADMLRAFRAILG